MFSSAFKEPNKNYFVIETNTLCACTDYKVPTQPSYLADVLKCRFFVFQNLHFKTD